MTTLIPVPLDGDPQSLARWAARYKLTAQNLKKAADDLRDLTDDESFVSLAVDGVRLKALEARASTESIYVRYDGAADTFARYATELEAAQARANRAIAAFHNADGPGKQAQAHRDELEEQTKADGGQTPNLLEEFLDAKRRAESYIAHAASALSEYNAAVQDKHDAVERAKHSLDKAGDKSGLNDNFFEAIGGKFQQAYELAQKYLAPLLEELHGILAAITDVLSVLAAILTVLAIFIPVLAPFAAILDTVVLVLSIALLAISLTLVLLNRGSLGMVLGDAIGVVGAAVGGKLAAGLTTKIVGKIGAVAAPAAEASTSFVVKNGSKLIEAGSELTVRAGGFAAPKITEPGVNALTSWSGVDLAPSAAGPDWNAPPTIQVPPVFNTEVQMQNVVVTHVSDSANVGMPVLATCNA